MIRHLRKMEKYLKLPNYNKKKFIGVPSLHDALSLCLYPEFLFYVFFFNKEPIWYRMTILYLCHQNNLDNKRARRSLTHLRDQWSRRFVAGQCADFYKESSFFINSILFWNCFFNLLL